MSKDSDLDRLLESATSSLLGIYGEKSPDSDWVQHRAAVVQALATAAAAEALTRIADALEDA